MKHTQPICAEKSMTSPDTLLPAGVRCPPPPRYSMRRLDHSHSEEIRLRDLRVRQQSPPTMPAMASNGRLLRRRGSDDNGDDDGVEGNQTTSSATAATAQGEFTIGLRRSSAPEGAGNAADDAFQAQSDSSGAAANHHHDRSRVQSAPASDRRGGGGCSAGGGTTGGATRSRTRKNEIDPGDHRRNRRRRSHHDVSPRAEEEEVFRFGIEQGVVPRLLSSYSSSSTPNNSSLALLRQQTGSFVQLSPAGGTGGVLPISQRQQMSRTSTLSGLGSGSGSGSRPRSQLAAVRAEREAVEAEARQAMAWAAPNLFPEIFLAPPATARGSGGSSQHEIIAGRRGWLAERG